MESLSFHMGYVSSNNGVQGYVAYGVHTLILGPGVARGTESFPDGLRIVVIAACYGEMGFCPGWK